MATAHVGRQMCVAHEPTEDDLPLLVAQPGGLVGEDPVTGDHLAGLAPAAWRPDEVVVRRRELGSAVAAGLLHGELEEMGGRSVVEPVGHRTVDDRVRHRVVGAHLDGQLLVDDLADLFRRTVGERDPGVVGETAKHHPDLFPELVDEDDRRAGVAQGAGDLAQRLRHQPGLETDVAVAHLALDLGPGHQRRHRVDDDEVDRAGADEHVGDLERLLTRVGLGDEERIGVDAELLGVVRVERVLGVDEGRDAAGLLGAGHRVQRHGCFSTRFRSVYLDDPTAGEATDAEGDVEGDRPRRDHLDRRADVVAKAHDGALAVLLLDLAENGLDRFRAIRRACRHVTHLASCVDVCRPPATRSTSAVLPIGRVVESDVRSGHRHPAGPPASLWIVGRHAHSVWTTLPNRCSTRARHARDTPDPRRRPQEPLTPSFLAPGGSCRGAVRSAPPCRRRVRPRPRGERSPPRGPPRRSCSPAN